MAGFSFTKNQRVYWGISCAIVAVALVMSLLGYGLNVGIDFTGGAVLEYGIQEAFETSAVETMLTELGVGEHTVAKLGEGETAKLEVRLRSEDATDDKLAQFERKLRAAYPTAKFANNEAVGAVAGRDLVLGCVYAALIAVVCMLVYISFRFDALQGLTVFVGLIHDLAVMLSVLVICRAFISVNITLIAALMAIVGYSINNTIVLFDRVRENRKRTENNKAKCMDIVETSVRQTLARSVNTSLTTLIAVVVLAVLGVAGVREFTLALIIGIVVGTYSSVMLSAQLWATWVDNRTFPKMIERFTKKANA